MAAVQDKYDKLAADYNKLQAKQDKLMSSQNHNKAKDKELTQQQKVIQFLQGQNTDFTAENNTPQHMQE